MGHRVDVWLLNPDDLPADDGAALLSILSPAERLRWSKFRFRTDADLYLAAHAGLRLILSTYTPMSPAAWRTTANRWGRPELVGGCSLRFNLSHTHGAVAIAVADGVDVGVDVERARANPDLELVAERVFSDVERRELFALPEAARVERFFALWTLKEAYIKARGMGLSLPLQQITLRPTADGAEIALDPRLGDDARRWRFARFGTAEHPVAVAVPGRPSSIAVREVDAAWWRERAELLEDVAEPMRLGA